MMSYLFVLDILHLSFVFDIYILNMCSVSIFCQTHSFFGVLALCIYVKTQDRQHREFSIFCRHNLTVSLCGSSVKLDPRLNSNLLDKYTTIPDHS